MLGRQILKSRFGKHYKIHFIKDGPVPRSLRPLRFSGSYSARRFLQELQVPPSFWAHMALTCVDAAPLRNHHSDHLQVVCNSILSGRMRIYEVELPDTHALSRSTTAVQDRQGYQYQFVPMRQALATSGRTPRRFSSAQQVYETLYDLAPNLEQLQALASSLQFTPAPEQQTYTQLIEALAEELAEQRIALYVTAPFKRPEPAGAALEAATNMPGNRKVELAPATPAVQTESKVFQQAVSDKIKPVVTAEARVNGAVFSDVNQTARVGASVNQPTLIAERIAEKSEQSGKSLPNGNMGTAHAEVGAIQRAFDAGATAGADMTLTVTGKAVCGFCRGDVAAMAQKAELKSLTVYEKATGNTLYWQPGMKSLKKVK